MTFLLLFNSLKFGKTSLFCCNGYSHAIFTILFYESQVEELKISFKNNEVRRRISWIRGLRGIGIIKYNYHRIKAKIYIKN